jgi:GntR family transcriptional regulator
VDPHGRAICSGRPSIVALTCAAGRRSQTARPTRSQATLFGVRQETPMYGARAKVRDCAGAVGADGEARPGDRLPPARDLAAVLGVNTNTVLRALRALRDEGLLDFRRGRGVTVSGAPEHSAVVDRARELVRFARTHGYRRDELLALIERIS